MRVTLIGTLPKLYSLSIAILNRIVLYRGPIFFTVNSSEIKKLGKESFFFVLKNDHSASEEYFLKHKTNSLRAHTHTHRRYFVLLFVTFLSFVFCIPSLELTIFS